jgi:hypothetical protein
VNAHGRHIEIALPTLHPGQVAAFREFQACDLLAVRCGRRWGKTDFGKVLASDRSLRGHPVGWFAPDYRIMAEAYNEIVDTLEPAKKSSSKMEGIIRTVTGGRIDFWTLENERAGRSRKYKLAIVDEGAFTKPNMMAIWEQSIKPTLLDLGGKCIVLSNANGVAPDNFLHQICTEAKYGFREYHAPTSQNPHVPHRLAGEADAAWQARREETFAKLKRDNHPLVYQQEYLAEFVDFSGVAFFGREALLVNGQPVAWPKGCDSVFAVIDSAVKSGREHDGTAVSYWAHSTFGTPLIGLDWDVVSIDGAMLEEWVPGVQKRLEFFAHTCRARYGAQALWIEDAQSGSILLQQCAARGIEAEALPAQLTAAGKDARAINASGPVHRGEVKISEYAFEKVVEFKGQARNHFLTQLFGFRVGDKDAAKRADDLLDTFTYAVAISLGDSEGIA